MVNEQAVCIAQKTDARYPSAAPFHPSTRYPELAFADVASERNAPYALVRHAFELLGYDRERFDTPAWNPLAWLIKSGDVVFLKPNMIAEKHARDATWDHVITNGAVVRAVIDYVYLALGGRGTIIVGDGPQTDSDFDATCHHLGLREIQQLYRREKRFEIEIVDLRDEHWIVKDGVAVERRKLSGDPRGKVRVNLGRRSALAALDGTGRRYYGAFYDTDETNRHHRGGVHEYDFSKSPLAADVLISIPKLKSHKKCGLTVNLKGNVGLNANKNLLPHYAFGSPRTGGDQFPADTAKGRLENALVTWGKRKLLDNNKLVQRIARTMKQYAYAVFGRTDEVVRSGNWHGNDTVWRMALDLSRIAAYANADGTWRDEPRRFFSVVDAIVCMEGDGPVSGGRKPLGIVMAGANPVAVDATCARLMGLDVQRLPLIREALASHELPLFRGRLEDITCASNVERWNRPPSSWSAAATEPFDMHFAWRGHVELAT